MKKEITNVEINASIDALNEKFSNMERRMLSESYGYHFLKGKCDAYERVLIKHGLIDELKNDRLKFK